ncbi:unnamed protein product, partial [Brassica oleracea var. botrytis]
AVAIDERWRQIQIFVLSSNKCLFVRCITVFQIEAACVTTKGKGGSGTVYGERTIKGLMKLTSS